MKLLGNYLPDPFIPRMSCIPAEFHDRGVNAVSGLRAVGGRRERKRQGSGFSPVNSLLESISAEAAEGQLARPHHNTAAL